MSLLFSAASRQAAAGSLSALHTITTRTPNSLAAQGVVVVVVVGIKSSRAREMIGTLVIQTVSGSVSEGNRNVLVWVLESHAVC